MLHYLSSTARSSLISPSTCVIGALALFVGWFGGAYSILALDDSSRSLSPLYRSTALLGGACVVLWSISRAMEDDRRSSFQLSADQSTTGVAGRLAGRCLGAALAGVLVCGAIFALLGLSASIRGGKSRAPADERISRDTYASKSSSSNALLEPRGGIARPISLRNTNISQMDAAARIALGSFLALLCCAAWVVAISRWLHPAVGLIGGGLAWGAAHIPWARGGFFDSNVGGTLGTVLTSVLPPVSTVTQEGGAVWGPLGACACAASGLLLLAIAAPAQLDGRS